MSKIITIEMDDEDHHKLTTLCKGDNKLMQEYIIRAVNTKISQDMPSPDEKESLSDYLNKGQPGSRNYGVKGQGW